MKPMMSYFIIISVVVYLTIAIVDAEDRHSIRGSSSGGSGTVQIQDDDESISIKRVIKGYEDNNIVKRLRRVTKQKRYSNKQPGINNRGGQSQKNMKRKGNPPGINKDNM